jgi:hypothetical protein
MSSSSDIADDLLAQNLISKSSHSQIKTAASPPFFSIHFELNTILYAGILCLSTGLGLLVYNNISSIGHISILTCIALICVGSFAWCFGRAAGFSFSKVQSPARLDDYLLLLSGLTLVTFFGYLQFQFSLFGKMGFEFLLPALLCFWAAYYFDHLGVLSISITSLGAFMGIAMSPFSKEMYTSYNTSSEIFGGLFLSLLLVGLGIVSHKKALKSHFTFTFFNFALHTSFFASIAAIFILNYWVVSIPLLLIISWRAHMYARKQRSFYFFLVSTLYSYLAVICLYFKGWFSLRLPETDFFFYFTFFLLIVSSIVVIRLIRSFRKQVTSDDNLQ